MRIHESIKCSCMVSLPGTASAGHSTRHRAVYRHWCPAGISCIAHLGQEGEDHHHHHRRHLAVIAHKMFHADYAFLCQSAAHLPGRGAPHPGLPAAIRRDQVWALHG